MIEVDLPDGSVAEFPDGTAPEVMKQAISKKFPVQQPESQQSQDLRSQMSAATQNPARAQYDALPGWQKPIVAASDTVNLLANGATMGFGDKAAARARSMMNGTSYDEELANQRVLTEGSRQRAGSAGTAAEITGAVSTPLSLAGKGITLAGRGGTAALTGLKGLAARTGLMGAEGAGYGALTAAGNDQDMGTGIAAGALGGAAGNVVGEGISAGLGKVAGAFNKGAPKTETEKVLAKLNANKEDAYALSERAGVMIKPAGMKHLQDRVQADLATFGYRAKLHPGAKEVLDAIAEDQGKNVTLKGLDTIRKVAGNAYDPLNKSNNAAVAKIIDHIDDLTKSNDPNLMAGINTKIGAQALDVARKFAHRSFKLEKVTNLLKKADQNAGKNFTNTELKSPKEQLAKINDPFRNWGRGFTDVEKAAADKAARFTPTERSLHGLTVMNPFSGGKLGMGLQVGTALAHGFNPVLLAGQAVGAGVGFGAQKAAQHLAKKNIEEFVSLVANGGVPPTVVQNALQLLAKSKRDAITRSLMAIGVQQSSRAQAPAQ